jgi:fibronectin-binding autotransporter adhesin
MMTQIRILILCAGLLVCAILPLRAQIVADGATNTLSNVTNTFPGTVIVGTNGSFTLLTIADNALLTNSANGVIGLNASAKSNEVWLVSANARWLMGNHLFVGNDGSFNRLVVSNGGLVRDQNGYLGPNASSSNNLTVVTGPGSMWSNANLFYLGFNGAGNQLVVSNGGVLRNNSSSIGVNNTSSSNLAVVTGPGSLWTNADTLQIRGGGRNQMLVTNGGAVRSRVGAMGLGTADSNNLVVVTGSGSTWSNAAELYVGHSSIGNTLVVTDIVFLFAYSVANVVVLCQVKWTVGAISKA